MYVHNSPCRFCHDIDASVTSLFQHVCVNSGASKEMPSPIIQPTTSHERAATASSPQPPMQTSASATELLSTSGTFEKVPSPAPESFEQLSMPAMQESRVMTEAAPSEQSAAAASQLTTSAPADSPVQTSMALIHDCLSCTEYSAVCMISFAHIRGLRLRCLTNLFHCRDKSFPV